MRVAITIIYNGLHHLKYQGFADFMVKHFDHWIVVEGYASNGGSTSWCKQLKVPHNSDDGTIEFMKQLADRHSNVTFYSHHKPYKSKDEQFNKAIVILKTVTNKCWLWQVDADEHWNAQELALAERQLWRSPCKVASFQFNHFVKQYEDYSLIALGDWGSGRVNRLWKWAGQQFESHEPAVMVAQKDALELPYRFNHYSMVHAKDVKFKSKSYKGHEMVYMNWRKLDDLDHDRLPVHISTLFGKHNPIGRSNSFIYKIKDQCVNVPNHADLKAVGELTMSAPVDTVNSITLSYNNQPNHVNS